VSIGETLAGARRQKGLSTQDIADTTRIRRTVVEAIERDDFALCGGDVYARGHIRIIAKVVGLDPAPLLAEFQSEHQDDAPSVRTIFEADKAAKPERRPNWSAAMGAVLVLLVAVGIFQASRVGNDDPAGGGATADQTTSPAPSPSEATAQPSATPAPTLVAEVPPGVSVRLTVNGGTTWVSAVAGETTVFEGLVHTGEVRDFSDPNRVKLVLGNAGVAHLIVNGKDLGTAGGAGEVVRVTFVPGDPTAAVPG
jgi:cytoskeletal protein RodZ